MQAPPLIDSLASIAPRYDALLCDAWGVIHNGVALFSGAADALVRFRRERGPVVILTNAPRPSSIIPPQLAKLGLTHEAFDAVITAGDAARAEIAARVERRCYRLGPPKDDYLYEGLPMNFAPLEEAEFISCTGLVNDHSEEPQDYRPLLAAAAARELPMICANPDVVVRWGSRLIWCAGALAQLYEDLGGTVIYGGKPHPSIYALALARVKEARGAAPDRARVLAVGDGLKTDIAGANAQGFDAVFVAHKGGVHEGDLDAAAIVKSLAEAGVTAVALMERLAW